MRHKRPSVSLNPRIKARARELRAQGLSYTQIGYKLDDERLSASRAAIWAACQETDAGPAASFPAAPPPPTTSDESEPDDADAPDAQERADDLRAIAGEAAAEVREVTRHVRGLRASGEVTLDDAAKLMSIAERAEKLAKLLDARAAPARTPVPEAKPREPERSPLESGVLAALKARRASGPVAEASSPAGT